MMLGSIENVNEFTWESSFYNELLRIPQKCLFNKNIVPTFMTHKENQKK